LSSKYVLNIEYTHKGNFYGDSGAVWVRGKLTYGDETVADEQFGYEPTVRDRIVDWAREKKFAHQVKLGNVKPEAIELED